MAFTSVRFILLLELPHEFPFLFRQRVFGQVRLYEFRVRFQLQRRQIVEIGSVGHYLYLSSNALFTGPERFIRFRSARCFGQHGLEDIYIGGYIERLIVKQSCPVAKKDALYMARTASSISRIAVTAFLPPIPCRWNVRYARKSLSSCGR